MRQLTFAPHGHILTHCNVWSPDGQWIVYDVRSDPAGSVFDGTRIEEVNVRTGEIRVLYESAEGACCGVASSSPVEDSVVFILGPERPTADWQYAPEHRRGIIVNASKRGRVRNLDARDLAEPFTPGALRGGTHLHTFSGDGKWVAFTYHDDVLARLGRDGPGHDLDQRNIGVCAPVGPVRVGGAHPRNHHGDYFSVLVTRTVNDPKAGSDEIDRAAEEAWVGSDGYVKSDGTRQKRALAFQGRVAARLGEPMLELFIIDFPEDVRQPVEGPLQGTSSRRPFPPAGTRQRRLTFTEDRRHPGLALPRHWPASSPDGARIAFLMKDDMGIAQLWTISPNGGPPRQITRDPWPVASAFSWSADGTSIAYVADNSVFVVDADTGVARRVTPRGADANAPRPEACVFSPDGNAIAFVRPSASGGKRFNQIYVAGL